MDNKSAFGAEPERIDRLLSFGLEDSGSEDKAEQKASVDFFTEAPGSWVGRYKLLSVLGEGGMGIVYLAEQERPIKRQVALKVIKPGMDSKRVIARFEAERQALALLDHPNVAHVLDAGTTEHGRPYFVMEYVKGLPITDHCDKKELTIKDRLDLFLQVCNAVHHAHQKGIIHRDIKPSNILISTQDDQIVPKIIDFGVAKATAQNLTERTLYTEQGQLFGTPEYMSPEQADMANDDIDTRTDIYSLGVLLYILLTGALPFDSEILRAGGIDNVRGIICKENPRSPSTRLLSLGPKAEIVAQQRQTGVTSLARRLHRELEWIPLKAMRQDRTRRYRSAAEFADDIENYLKGIPLIAGPESVTYRIRKFARRYRIPVIATVAVAAVLLLATVISTVLYNLASDRAEAYRRVLYVNQMALAHSAYKESDVDRAKKLLTNCPVDLRDFAWSYLWRLCSVIPTTPTLEHSDQVNAVAFSPTDEILATASGNSIILWNTSSQKIQATLEGHSGAVLSLAFSPDEDMILSISSGGTAFLWDVPGRRLIRQLAGPEEAGLNAAATFSNDGQNIAAIIGAGQSSSVMLWNVNTGEYLSLPFEGDKRVFSIAFSGDDKILAVGGRNRILVWEVAKKRLIAELRALGHIEGVLFLADHRTLVSTGSDGDLTFWDVGRGEKTAIINAHAAPVYAMVLSPDRKVLATGGADSSIRLWDTVTRHETARLRGHTSEIRSLAFSADGKLLASGSKDGTSRLWEPTPRPDYDTLTGHNTLVQDIAFTADGKRIITSAFGPPTVKMWDVASGKDLSDALGDPEIPWTGGLGLSPDGQTLAIGTRDLVLWDTTTRQEMCVLPYEQDRGGGSVNCAVFSPDGKTIASHTYPGIFKLWDLATKRELILLKGYGSHYGALAFSPDGRMLAVPRRAEPTIVIWKTSTLCAGQADESVALLTGHSESVNGVAFSPDGQILASAGHDTTIKLWDLDTQKEITTLTGHTSNVHCVTFSPDGRTLASGGNDGTVRLWNLILNEQVAVLEGHGSGVWEVIFSPDGLTLASSSLDGTIKLWRAATEHEIQAQSHLFQEPKNTFKTR
ncbi:MAG: protein kinase domain-containing protein [Planctomycetota bacterium]|jgi:WD40 repeat protein/tRNA A-37 threonylcarbamoyl transferase component Bud32